MTNPPAFPCDLEEKATTKYGDKYTAVAQYSGIDTRTYFAAKAMQGLLANSGEREDLSLVQIIAKSVQAADLLMAELAKTKAS